MPVEMKWHSELPVLQATYTGVLKARDYYAMCEQREKMLAAGPERVILLMDASQFESFADADSVDRYPNVLLDTKVVCLLVVLQESLYNSLSRTFRDALEYPVRVFKNSDYALAQAKSLADQF